VSSPTAAQVNSVVTTVQRCIQLLQDQFGDSPRVDCLSGIRLEATETSKVALDFYDDVLKSDPTNAVRSFTFITKPLLNRFRRSGDARLTC
jgi:hypothetical protein